MSEQQVTFFKSIIFMRKYVFFIMNKKTALRYCLIFLLVLNFVPIHGQFNRFGGGLTFNSTIKSSDLNIGNPGFNFRGVMEIGDKFFLIPSITFQLPKKKVYLDGEKITFFGNLDVNLTYTLATEKQLLFYALAGADLTNVYTTWDTEVPGLGNKYEILPGFAIGTGIEMIVEKDINAFAQVKYIISKYQQLIIYVGIHYYFVGRKYRTW